MQTTTPREVLSSTARKSAATTAVIVTATATTGTQPDPSDRVSYAAAGCGKTQATTSAYGTAANQLYCQASALPVTVTISDARGLTSSIRVT